MEQVELLSIMSNCKISTQLHELQTRDNVTENIRKGSFLPQTWIYKIYYSISQTFSTMIINNNTMIYNKVGEFLINHKFLKNSIKKKLDINLF